MSLHIAGEKLMVYCSKCGTKNEDDAMVCVNCGASLETGARLTRRYERHMEQECFGIPRGGSIVGMIIGLIIVLLGVSWILSAYYNIKLEIWPIVAIIFGILIIVGAYYGMRRRS
jgi:uncharacterized membrane protein YvbJ